jgi:hypothetical protein
MDQFFTTSDDAYEIKLLEVSVAKLQSDSRVTIRYMWSGIYAFSR